MYGITIAADSGSVVTSALQLFAALFSNIAL